MAKKSNSDCEPIRTIVNINPNPPKWLRNTKVARTVQEMIEDCSRVDSIDCLFNIGATDQKGERIR